MPSQWKGQNFDPPQLPHFSTDFNETQNQERYAGYDPARKIWLMWVNGKGSVKMANFGLLLVLSFFCTLRVTLRPDHTVGPITTNEGSKRVFLHNEVPFGGLNDKKYSLRVKTP